MSDDSFIEAILADPDDAALRLVYADWLEERGDPRGEFLRTSVALEDLPGQDQRSAALAARLEQLRPVLDTDWLALFDRPSAEEAVREAVFRALLQRRQGDGLCFLAVEGQRDLSPALLERLKDLEPGLKPVSASRQNEEAFWSGITDRQTGEEGTLYGVGAIQWESKRACEVEGSSIRGPLAEWGYRYRVEIQGRRWVVTNTEFAWIS
jgi:uncharacterized protein (TIGR02996 family)